MQVAEIQLLVFYRHLDGLIQFPVGRQGQFPVGRQNRIVHAVKQHDALCVFDQNGNRRLVAVFVGNGYVGCTGL